MPFHSLGQYNRTDFPLHMNTLLSILVFKLLCSALLCSAGNEAIPCLFLLSGNVEFTINPNFHPWMLY